MCSKYAATDEYVSSGQERFFYNSTFSADALQQRMPGSDVECLGPELTRAQSAIFLDYLYAGFLQKSRIQGQCGSCWAYSISAGVQYATALAYQRLGGWFNNRYMSPQLLLSCVEAEGVACGCYGGDLAAAMALVSKEGIVTFRQFSYENDSSVVTQEGQVHYICRPNEGEKGFLGTCAPCKVDEPDFEEVVSTVSGPAKTTTAFVTLSSCMPCNSVGAPFYFPISPCRLFREEESLEANVEAIKRSLRAHGPLCATLRVNREAMNAVGKSQLLSNVLEAPVYKPQSTPMIGALHSIVIIGYVDPWAQSQTREDRARSVFICRNSWGPEWGFKMKTRQIEQEKDGAQKAVEVILGGFFAVSMYESFEAIGLLQTAIAIQGVNVRTLGDEAPRPLRITDPFVVPFKAGFLEAFRSSASQTAASSLASARDPRSDAMISDKGAGERRRFPWEIVIGAVLAASLLLAILLIFVWE
jgi:Papain family cysteine protease